MNALHWKSTTSGALLLASLAFALPLYAQSVRPDSAKMKSSDALREVFRSIVEKANRSTVLVKGRVGVESAPEGVQLAFGTVVSADGFILTKASEVLGQPFLQVFITAKKGLPAKIVGLSEPQDLAMLKIDLKDGDDLTPVEWADLKADKIIVGAWLATAGPVAMEQNNPVAVGVVSVGRRKIPGRNGFLGVYMGDTTDASGAKSSR